VKPHLAAFVAAAVLLAVDSAVAARLRCTTLSHVKSNADGKIEEADPAEPFAATWRAFDFDTLTLTLTLTNTLPDQDGFSQRLQKGLLNATEFVGFFRIGPSPVGMLHISLSGAPMTFSLYRTRDFLSGVCTPAEEPGE
jgi:hypothetical protein